MEFEDPELEVLKHFDCKELRLINLHFTDPEKHGLITAFAVRVGLKPGVPGIVHSDRHE